MYTHSPLCLHDLHRNYIYAVYVCMYVCVCVCVCVCVYIYFFLFIIGRLFLLPFYIPGWDLTSSLSDDRYVNFH